MDIGVYWSPVVLEHKRERREQRGHPEEVWNCRHLPKGLGEDPGGDRLVIGCRGRWVGAFGLVPEVLYIATDPACPYALIFDVKSWTPLAKPVPCTPFRGWKYLTDPPEHTRTSTSTSRHAKDGTEPPSTDVPHHRR